MARTREKRGEEETKAAAAEVKKTGKPAGGARSGITAPVTPSAELAEIVGKESLPRSEVTSKVWDYIKKHDLQNPADKREIVPDATLAKVLGKDKVTMFEMTRLVSQHLK